MAFFYTYAAFVGDACVPSHQTFPTLRATMRAVDEAFEAQVRALGKRMPPHSKDFATRERECAADLDDTHAVGYTALLFPDGQLLVYEIYKVALVGLHFD